MDKDDRAKMLKKPLNELIGSVGSGYPGSAFEYVLSAIINYKLQLRTIRATWVLAILSIMVSLWSVFISHKQFQIENRPYIGLEHLTGVSTFDTTPLKEGEGWAKVIFDETIKNYGHLPAFFKLSSTNEGFTCVESPLGQIMPGQEIEMHCERLLGNIEPGENFCEAATKEEIRIEYGLNKNKLDREIIIKMRLENMPGLPTLKKLVEESCSEGDSLKSIQWFVTSST